MAGGGLESIGNTFSFRLGESSFTPLKYLWEPILRQALCQAPGMSGESGRCGPGPCPQHVRTCSGNT